MNGIWLDEPESEAIDLLGIDDIDGGYFDAGSGEAATPRDHRGTTLARRAQIAQAVRSQARSGALTSSHPATPRSELRRTQAAVINVDVDNKVQADAFGRALQREARRIDGAQAAIAGVAVGRQLEDSFPRAGDGVVGALLRGAPLVLLWTRREPGIGSLFANPQWLGLGLIAAIFVAREARDAGWFRPPDTDGTS